MLYVQYKYLYVTCFGTPGPPKKGSRSSQTGFPFFQKGYTLSFKKGLKLGVYPSAVSVSNQRFTFRPFFFFPFLFSPYPPFFFEWILFLVTSIPLDQVVSERPSARPSGGAAAQRVAGPLVRPEFPVLHTHEGVAGPAGPATPLPKGYMSHPRESDPSPRGSGGWGTD